MIWALLMQKTNIVPAEGTFHADTRITSYTMTIIGSRLNGTSARDARLDTPPERGRCIVNDRTGGPRYFMLAGDAQGSEQQDSPPRRDCRRLVVTGAVSAAISRHEVAAIPVKDALVYRFAQPAVSRCCDFGPHQRRR